MRSCLSIQAWISLKKSLNCENALVDSVLHIADAVGNVICSFNEIGEWKSLVETKSESIPSLFDPRPFRFEETGLVFPPARNILSSETIVITHSGLIVIS